MSAPLPFRRALVIVNPIAGRGRGAQHARVLHDGLQRAGVTCEVFETAARGDARARAASVEPDVDLLVSIGGDGTLSEVLAGLPRRDLSIAVLPMGTANVLALDLCLPRGPEGTLRMLAAPRRQQVDTATVNGTHLSFLVTGIGFDAMVVREVARSRRGPITKASWVRAGVSAALGYRTPRLAVEIDGRAAPGHCSGVLLSNIVHYGGFDVLAPDRKLDDGLFEVYCFRARGRLALGKWALRGALARFPGGDVTCERARHVRVVADEPVPFQVDGDHDPAARPPWTTPLDLVVGSDPFTLVVP